MALGENEMQSQHDTITILSQGVECARKIILGILAIATFFGGIYALARILPAMGDLISHAWFAWGDLLTLRGTNVWPATVVVWISSICTAWCTCMAFKVRPATLKMKFGLIGTTLFFVGAVPANFAAMSIVQDWDLQYRSLADGVAALSTTLFSAFLVGAFAIGLLSLIFFISDATREAAK